MSKPLREVTVSKAAVIAILLALGIMPWFQGGRDPVGWMVLLGVSLLGSFILWRSDLKLSFNRLTVAWLALLAWTALSLIWSVNRFQTVTTLMLYLFVGIIYALASGIRSDKSAVVVWRQAYLIIATIASAVGVVFFLLYSYNRVTSTFYLPNPFAAFLLPAIIIGLWQFSEKHRLMDGLLTMFNLGVFILIDSRGGTLALIAVIFVALMLSKNLVRHWRRIALVLVGALAVALLANVGRSLVTHHLDFQGQRYQQLTSDQSNSTTDRIYYLRSAVSIWADRPVLGSGAGTYSTMHPKYQFRVISAGNNAHNFYVQTLAELGIVGLGLVIWVIIVLIIGIVQELKVDPRKLPLALGLLALLLHAAVDIDSNYPVLWAMAAILAGLCYLPTAERKRLSGYLPGVILAASLLLAVPTVWLFQGSYNAVAGSNNEAVGDVQAALKSYQLANAHQPSDPDWLDAEGINSLLMAQIGNDKNADLAQALILAQAAAKRDPYDAQHDLLLGRVYLAQNKLDLAEAAYKQAIAKDPYNQPDYYNDLATLYLRQNKLAAAKSTVAVALALYNRNVLANRNNDTTLISSIATSHVIQAQVLIQQGQTDAARAELRQALALDPSNLAAKIIQTKIGQ